MVKKIDVQKLLYAFLLAIFTILFSACDVPDRDPAKSEDQIIFNYGFTPTFAFFSVFQNGIIPAPQYLDINWNETPVLEFGGGGYTSSYDLPNQ